MKNLFLALSLFAVANATAADQQFTPQYVDLGLPSGTLWATSNVGADKPEGLGDYFAWGETKPKTVYEWENYAHVGEGGTEWLTTKKGPGWYDIKKYTRDDGLKGSIWYQGTKFIGDNKTTLEPTDNVAAAKWGGDWDMPTSSDLEELYKNCYFVWTTNYSGASGYIVYKAKADGDKGKVNGSPAASYSTSDTHIFLPAAGYRRDNGFIHKDKRGHYWSKSLNPVDTHNGNCFGFSESSVSTSYLDIVVGDNGNRFRGYPVRPICPRDGIPMATPPLIWVCQAARCGQQTTSAPTLHRQAGITMHGVKLSKNRFTTGVLTSMSRRDRTARITSQNIR